MKKKYFFGWENIRWFITELALTFSEMPSFFSSKRIERALLFTTALTAWIVWFGYHFKTLTYIEMMASVGMLFGFTGYILKVTEKSKEKNETNSL
jgi:hypothetical protein